METRRGAPCAPAVTLRLFATGGFPPSRDTNSRAGPILVCIPRFGPSALLTTAQRFCWSRFGTLAAGSLSPPTSWANIRAVGPSWFAHIRSGLSSPAHGLRASKKEMTLDCPFRNPLQSRVIPVRSCYLTSFWLPLFLSDLHNQSIHFLNLLLNDINCSALRIIPHT